MEEKRPGEYFPIEEDGKGSYILSSRDMCMIDHVGELMEAGLDSLKIEGRAKSAYYAALVTGAYRHAIDAAAAGTPLDPVWRDEVEKVSHRHYSTGFYYGEPGQYTQSSRYIREWQIVGIVEDCAGDGTAVVSLRNKFRAGDALELVGPDLRPVAFSAPEMTTLEVSHWMPSPTALMVSVPSLMMIPSLACRPSLTFAVRSIVPVPEQSRI
jgi:putative protease